MSWSAHQIGRLIARQTLASKCIVLVDNCNWTGHEADILGVTTDLRLIDIEVKISRADLRADASKRKWWTSIVWDREARVWEPLNSREHPPRVWKHYYAMPAEIWDDSLIDSLGSPASGVLLLDRLGEDRVAVKCVRRAKPARDAYRLKPEQALDIARLANLRMWDSYELLEARR